MSDERCIGCHNAETLGYPCKMGYTACEILLSIGQNDDVAMVDVGNQEKYTARIEVIAGIDDDDRAVMLVHYGTTPVFKVMLASIRAVRSKHFADGSAKYEVVFN